MSLPLSEKFQDFDLIGHVCDVILQAEFANFSLLYTYRVCYLSTSSMVWVGLREQILSVVIVEELFGTGRQKAGRRRLRLLAATCRELRS